MPRSYTGYVRAPWCTWILEIQVTACTPDGARVAVRDELRLVWRWRGAANNVEIDVREMSKRG